MAITLKELLDNGAGRLALELVWGEGRLNRAIEEKADRKSVV